MVQLSEFPEISEFLENMHFKTSVMGYDREDVLIKMQQLNRLYQDRILMMRGQVNQADQPVQEGVSKEAEAQGETDRVRKETQYEVDRALKEAQDEINRARKEAQDEVNRARREAQDEADRVQREAQIEIERMIDEARQTLQREREEMQVWVREEERAAVLAEVEEREIQHQKELMLLNQELKRMVEHLQTLQKRTGRIIGEI